MKTLLGMLVGLNCCNIVLEIHISMGTGWTNLFTWFTFVLVLVIFFFLLPSPFLVLILLFLFLFLIFFSSFSCSCSCPIPPHPSSAFTVIFHEYKAYRKVVSTNSDIINCQIIYWVYFITLCLWLHPCQHSHASGRKAQRTQHPSIVISYSEQCHPSSHQQRHQEELSAESVPGGHCRESWHGQQVGPAWLSSWVSDRSLCLLVCMSHCLSFFTTDKFKAAPKVKAESLSLHQS